MAQNNDRYLSLVNTIDGIVWEADAQTFDFTFVSQKAEEMLGYPCEDWLTPGFWANHIHPQDKSWAVEYCEKSTKLKEQHEFEYRFITASGGIVWLKDIVSVISEDDSPTLLRGVMIDVTKEKQAELKLQKSRQHLDYIIEGTQTGTWEWNIQTGMLSINHIWAELIGYTLEELEPINIDLWRKLTHPEDLAHAEDQLSEHFENSDHFYDCKIRMFHKQGYWVWIQTRGQVVTRTSDGQPLLMYGTHLDITETESAAEALATSEKRYKAFIRSSNTGAWEYHPFSSHIWCSEEYFSMLGLNASDYQHYFGQDSLQELWRDFVHPNDIEAAEKVFNNYLETLDSTYENIFRMRHADGSWLWIWSRAHTYFEGIVPVCIGTHINITSQKAVELKLQAHQKEQQQILDNMVDGIITINHLGEILTFNRAAELLFGYSKEEVQGQNVKLLMTDPHQKNHDRYIKDYLTTEKPKIIGIGREVEARKKDGTLFPMRLSVSELPEDETGRKRFIGSCHDLTIEKEQEQLLNRSQKMDALGKLVGGIAHDFNNILGIMIGYTEMLQAFTDEDSREARYINEIALAGERATALTRKLLNFSSRKMSSAKALNLNEIITNERLMFEKALTPSIKLQLELDEQLWSTQCEESDLENSLLNLAINASHAMEAGGCLTLQTSNICFTEDDTNLVDMAPGEYIRLSVIDDGCGMDQETIQQIFDPFFSTKGDMGTGLGLAQVYGMMQRCGGVVRVYSEVGQGTQFNLYFPRYYKAQELKEVRHFKPQHTAGTESILIVDDEPQLREMLSELLKSRGYKIEVAIHAEEAIERLKDKQTAHELYDLVLTDIIMPGMHGTELAAYIKQHYPKTLIQLMSGYSDERHKGLIDDQLYNNRIYKPVRQDELLGRIRAMLDSKHQ